MSRLRNKLLEISKNTKLNESNKSNLSTRQIYKQTINQLENTIYTDTFNNDNEKLILHFTITTSRDPSSFLITFTKHIANLLNIKYQKRGKATLSELSILNVIVVEEVKGKINNLIISSQNGSFYFNISNMKLNRNNARFGKIDLVTHNLLSQQEAVPRHKKDVAFNKLHSTLSRMFPKKEEDGRKKKFNKKPKTRKLGFMRTESSDLVTFLCMENNEFLTSFDMKMYKCVSGNIDFEGEEIWKSREFLNSA
ncbi:hypothetical protein CDIK_1349 [Cucumispora dikerogammari]|nr:hypothetical protein CDIK_1349 [Cucumispora dikerogammari]